MSIIAILEPFLNQRMMQNARNKSRKWLTVRGQSKQANIHIHRCSEVTL